MEILDWYMKLIYGKNEGERGGVEGSNRKIYSLTGPKCQRKALLQSFEMDMMSFATETEGT